MIYTDRINVKLDSPIRVTLRWPIVSQGCRALVRCACWLTTLVVLVYLCRYVIDAHKRTTKTPGCHWNAVPNPGNLPYSASFCYLNKETVLLRLYDQSGKKLLAERTYFHLDRPFVLLKKNELIFDTYPDDAFIALPPSLFERLRAKLP